MAIVNPGILAHVVAGKTTLTERILFETGVINAVGSVDKGTAQTDTLELERARGITIKPAVVSFRLHALTVNLIDNPGHSDFVAEVERSLRVLDSVVLVISAVEAVQPQTRRLARAIRAAGLPLLIFSNKIDQRHAGAGACRPESAQPRPRSGRCRAVVGYDYATS
jgi:ribosomal protection tetracycline resistance protein